jgi:phosphoribosylaminoimidazole-succinocarboxamide synthase
MNKTGSPMSSNNPARPLFETDFPSLKFFRRGKVRDVYDLGEQLLIVATDRLSAFDVIMPDPIPDKGKVLTQISNFWFHEMRQVIPNHLVAVNVDDFPEACRKYRAELEGRSVVVKKTRPLPIECVVRGYLSGSGWNEYRESRSVCGIPLPGGLAESSRLPEPIFTPATKADVGHDENIDFARASALVGEETAVRVRRSALEIYRRATEIAERKGIIIADTKMEVGLLPGGELILIDELLTPDSSRFWPRETYAPGAAQESFDKQFVRDYLLSIGFNKQPPGPALPPEIIRRTSALYRRALFLLAGTEVA